MEAVTENINYKTPVSLCKIRAAYGKVGRGRKNRRGKEPGFRSSAGTLKLQFRSKIPIII